MYLFMGEAEGGHGEFRDEDSWFMRSVRLAMVHGKTRQRNKISAAFLFGVLFNSLLRNSIQHKADGGWGKKYTL